MIQNIHNYEVYVNMTLDYNGIVAELNAGRIVFLYKDGKTIVISKISEIPGDLSGAGYVRAFGQYPVQGTPTNGQTLVFNTDHFEYATPASGSSLSGLTTGKFPYATSASTIANSILEQLSTSSIGLTPTADGQQTLRVNAADGTARVMLGTYPAAPAYAGFWSGNITPSGTNHTFIGNGTTETIFNVPSTSGILYFRVNNAFSPSALEVNASAAGTGLKITGNAAGSGITVAAQSTGTNESITLLPKGNGQIVVPAGSVALPSITSSAASNTGFFFNSNPEINAVISATSAFRLVGNAAVFRSVTQLGFNSTSDPATSGSQDTAAVRAAAGIWRFTNGSTGAGKILLGTSSDTSSAQLDVRSQATGTPAAQFQAASGESASATVLSLKDGAGVTQFQATAGGSVTIGANSTGSISLVSGWLRFGGGISLGAFDDAQFGRAASHNIRMGPSDAATANAQTLSVQNVVAGTTNTAGANWTFVGSRGTGTGSGGSFVWQVAPLGSTGSAQNALVNAMTLSGQGALTLASGTITASLPHTITQTWNAAGTTFTPFLVNVTDTASAVGSLLADFQVGGTTKFSVNKVGTIRLGQGLTLANLVGTTSQIDITNANGPVTYIKATGSDGRTTTLGFNSNSLQASNARFESNIDGPIVHYLATNGNSTTRYFVLSSTGVAGSLQLGDSASSAPVAQTLSVQNVVAGTLNTAGANFTIKGSAGTGNAAGGDIIFQTAPLGTSGTTQNTFFDTLRIKPSGQIIAYNGGGTARTLFGAPSWDNSYMSFQNATLADIAANSALNQNPSGTTIVNAASGQTLNFRIGNVPAVVISSDLTATFSDKGIALGKTITASGTTGAQTINKSAGTVNAAAAATSIVVTNSTVTVNSLVFCQIRTDDATAAIKSVVPASGSFTINLTAPTAETSIGFMVVN